MGARHSGRESALQMLFQMEASAGRPEEVIALYWRHFEGEPEGRSYAEALVRGVSEKLTQVDATIGKASSNWRIERMSRVDRNILRLGCYELLERSDVPRPVILDEAVELAKAYGADESPSFVNGVLDRIANDVGRPSETK